jgi:hypothetical protein
MAVKRFQFQSAKQIRSVGGLPDAVEKTLTQFQQDTINNMRRGEACIVTSVTQPEDGVYFAIVLAGPFGDLQTLQAGLSSASNEDMLTNLNRIGLD